MNIDHVISYGFSGGGPAAINFAARHSNRTKALITEYAVTGGFTHHQIDELKSPGAKFALSSPFFPKMQRYMMRNHPESLLKTFIKNESTLTPEELDEEVQGILSDPRRMAVIPTIIKMTENLPAYPGGFETMTHEIQNYKDRCPLEEIKCPALIIHGTHDADVPFSQAEQAHSLIPNSELYPLEKGWHMLPFHANYPQCFQA